VKFSETTTGYIDLGHLKRRYIAELIENVKDRFPAVELLNAFKIFSTKELKKIEKIEDLAKFVDNEINIITKHYCVQKKNAINQVVISLWNKESFIAYQFRQYIASEVSLIIA